MPKLAKKKKKGLKRVVRLHSVIYLHHDVYLHDIYDPKIMIENHGVKKNYLIE